MAKIETSANSITSPSGIKYLVHPSLSRKRFEVLEKLNVEMEHGVSLTGFKTEAAQAYDLLNKGKQADAAVKLNNLLNGVARVENDIPHPVFFVCSLFICTETEDLSKWDAASATEKIKDWDGMDVDFFLTCARRFVARYLTGLESGSLNTSEV